MWSVLSAFMRRLCRIPFVILAAPSDQIIYNVTLCLSPPLPQGSGASAAFFQHWRAALKSLQDIEARRSRAMPTSLSRGQGHSPFGNAIRAGSRHGEARRHAPQPTCALQRSRMLTRCPAALFALLGSF